MVFDFFKKKPGPPPEEENKAPKKQNQDSMEPVPETGRKPAPGRQSSETKIEPPPLPEPEPKTEPELETEPAVVPEPKQEEKPKPETEPEPEPNPEMEMAAQVHNQDAIKIEQTDSGLFSKLKSGLSKTRKILNTDITELFADTTITEKLFDDLEELLVTSDLGIDVTMDIMERIRKKAKSLDTGEQLKAVLKEELLNLFPAAPEKPPTAKPHVIMMVGVNGTGKTTTLGKLAMRYTNAGKKVLIAAADTFRAAAIEQVEIWADRANAGIVRHKEGADPAAVAYDSVEAALARNVDVVLIDTAGRLHTQKNLMEELKKIKRSVEKKFKGAPHDVMMVIDATTGQNALSQAKIFNDAVGLTQISVTKLDGTAKGGIVAAVASKLDLPIAYIGVGEAIEDLQDFDAQRFVNALFD